MKSSQTETSNPEWLGCKNRRDAYEKFYLLCRLTVGEYKKCRSENNAEQVLDEILEMADQIREAFPHRYRYKDKARNYVNT